MATNKKDNMFRRLQNFMESYQGKVIMNFIYSWGASVVILGALFKLTHLPGGNVMLFIGMGTEVIVFFVSAFDKPFKNYKWESIFPQLKISGAKEKEIPDNAPDMTGQPVIGGGTIVTGGMPQINIAEGNAPQPAEGETGQPFIPQGQTTFIGGAAGFPQGQTIIAQGTAATPQGEQAAMAQGETGTIPQGQTAGMGGGTIIVGGMPTGGTMPEMSQSQEQIDHMKEASETYLNNLKDMSEALERFKSTTTTLADISESLASSYKIISDNSGNITANTQGYVYQMENLNRNLTGLNTIYDLQLRSISSQLDTIKQMNDGLAKIREMFENSTEDSEKFHQETERMARQIEELNAVYARMLNAMTVNMK